MGRLALLGHKVVGKGPNTQVSWFSLGPGSEVNSTLLLMGPEVAGVTGRLMLRGQRSLGSQAGWR